MNIEQGLANDEMRSSKIIIIKSFCCWGSSSRTVYY